MNAINRAIEQQDQTLRELREQWLAAKGNDVLRWWLAIEAALDQRLLLMRVRDQPNNGVKP